MIDTAHVTRYVAPLREGGSLPGIVEADDLGTYVCKFRGAGQGLRVLVAEVIASGLAQRLGLRTPRLVALELADDIARYEADEEVQDLLRASLGLNLGVDFLPGAFGFDGTTELPPGQAATVLWLDAFCANVDRSWRNPNLLLWGDELWVIDHGASLYFHHAWGGGITDPGRFAAQPWSADDHVLLDQVKAGGPEGLVAADTAARQAVTPEAISEVVAQVPDAWLERVPGADDPAAVRAAYVAFLTARLGTDQWWTGVSA